MSFLEKIVVTGGAGFIGSHLVERLVRDGCQVVVIDNLSTGRKENIEPFLDSITFAEADVGVAGDWISHFQGAQCVFHLAALADIVPSIQNPTAYYNANVTGTINVLQAARTAKAERFVYSASSSCYGIPDVYPTPETAPINPQYPYALTKRMGEELVLHWSKIYGLPAISLRFFNVYGTRSRTSGTYGAVFGVFLAQKLASKPFTIVGNGEQTRDFTYVTDVVDALIAAANSESKNTVFNVGSGASISVNQIAELIGGDRVYIPRRPGEPDCTYADISRIKAALSWEPKIAIEDGVSAVMRDINYWENAPVWDPGSIMEATSDWFKYLMPNSDLT